MAGYSKPSKKRAKQAFTQNSFRSTKSLSSIDINRWLKQLVASGQLLRPKKDYNHHYKTLFKEYHASLCCVVMPNTITMPTYKFESTYYVYFQFNDHVLKRRKSINKSPSNFSPNDFKTQKRFAYFILHIEYKQLVAIDKFIKQNNNNNKFFAQEYPKALPDTIRKRGNLQEKINYEERLLIKPKLPSGPSKLSLSRKGMTNKDLNNYANYLHAILASPALLLEDEIYEILKVHEADIVTLFKTLALQKIKSLKSEARKYNNDQMMRDPTKLKKKPFKFHTLWIVKRPLNNEKAKFVGLDHWALKFEGNGELMTTGFFHFSKEHGIILTKIVPNTPLNRRLFWYYWPRDNEAEVEHFNERWTVLEKIYLREMSCELVGILIEEWLRYDCHAVYELTHNNCQHFCRDFVAPLDIKIAKRLSASFDVRVAKSLVPAGILAEGIDAEAKCNNIHAKLWPICEEYKKQCEVRKNQPTDEQKEFQNNFDEIWNAFNLSSSDGDDDENNNDNNNNHQEDKPQINEMNMIIEEEEEKKINDTIEDMHDSLTIYKSALNPHGNEVYDDDESEVNSFNPNQLNHDQMVLTVSPSSDMSSNGK